MISSNSFIAQQTHADREMALRLEYALKGVGEQMIEQGKLMADGFQRLTWYTSCLTDNYQDVCTKLSSEDIRFLKGLMELVKRRNIIIDLISLYIETLLRIQSDDKIRKITQRLSKHSATFFSSGTSSRALALSIAMSVSYSFSINSSLGKKNLSRYSNISAMLLTGYGLAKKAADAAEELKRIKPVYYNVLYHENLEMMYFIVEPLIQRNYYLNSMMMSDKEITEAIMRLME